MGLPSLHAFMTDGYADDELLQVKMIMHIV